jgi:hypothetical protein
MKIKIYWTEENTKELLTKVNISLDELWLSSFIQVETTHENSLKDELNITKEPALIVEEKAIEFKDTIFEWIIPSDEELKSMFISIIWGWDTWDSCAPSACWTCSTWC